MTGLAVHQCGAKAGKKKYSRNQGCTRHSSDYPASLRGEPPALYNQVNGITNRNPKLTGYVAPMSNDLTMTSGLLQPLVDLVQESNEVK